MSLTDACRIVEFVHESYPMCFCEFGAAAGIVWLRCVLVKIPNTEPAVLASSMYVHLWVNTK